MKKLLITGFTTFSNHTENSSQIITELFKNTKLEGFEVSTAILPVDFSSSFDFLKTELVNFKPDMVMCLGLASNRKKISLEKVAINLIHSDMPDNEGAFFEDKTIVSEGTNGYFSTLPLLEMKAAAIDFPTEISFTAGTFVCNYIMYRLLDYYQDSKVKAGFIHLPNLAGNQQLIFETLIKMINSSSASLY